MAKKDTAAQLTNVLNVDVDPELFTAAELNEWLDRATDDDANLEQITTELQAVIAERTPTPTTTNTTSTADSVLAWITPGAYAAVHVGGVVVLPNGPGALLSADEFHRLRDEYNLTDQPPE